jgi:hypothetical protein
MSGDNQRRWLGWIFVAALTLVSTWSSAQDSHPASNRADSARFWIEPSDIPARNLYFGPGGEEGQPHGSLVFEKEDAAGTSPKFEVRDEDGTKWKAKLGPEAQPETVATRILWAVGFIANENYFRPLVMIQDLPHLKRGQQFVSSEGVKSVRLQRSGPGKKIGNWSWREKGLKGNREFNGLRVMMALLSNWDLKDDNNAIVKDPADPDHPLYEVSDLGASFGRSGKSYSDRITKHNLPAYRRSKFISKKTRDHVDFAFPTHPPFLYAFNLPFYVGKMRNHWIGKHIPRQDAKWVGTLLAQLTDQQIADAFRAGGYSPAEVDQYTAAVKSRIAELESL